MYWKAYLGSLVAFLALDAIWLGVAMRDYYPKQIGHLMKDNANFAAAAVFYAMYLAGVVFLAVKPALQQADPGTSPVLAAAIAGAVLGLIAYGTYGFTNLATLRGWPTTMVLVDTTWGTFLTGVTAAVGAWTAGIGS